DNLTAKTGDDQTISLGNDFTLDGCSSTLSSISLCDIEDILGADVFDDPFDIDWVMHIDGGGTIGIGSDGDDDLILDNVIANNAGLFPFAGTNFPDLGTYVFELLITYHGNPFDYDNITLTNDGAPLTATDEMTLYIVNISAPPMLALFGLGWAFTAYRRRKKV
ncbi:MAG: hypothetical protein JKY45_02890, partial [Emcibacter sp.]|nr:hypothetical protein [Emcibacter sp.]